MLPLTKQNAYRQRYRALHPTWQTSGDRYEQLVRAALTPQTRWLDIGGGRGGLIEKLNDQVLQSTALDPDLKSLATHRAPLVWRVGGLGEALPLAHQSYDLITAIWVLEHLADPQKVLAEIKRVLTPQGKFIFLTPNFHHPLLLTNYYLLRPLQSFLVPRLYARAEADTFPVRYRANTANALTRLLNGGGFTLDLHFIADPTYTAFNESLFRLSAWFENFIPLQNKIHLIGVATKN